MKKLFAIVTVSVFTLGIAQNTPKKDCCAGKDKKECKMDGKKTAKACNMKDNKDCKATKAKKSA
jgi:hypothetical protein